VDMEFDRARVSEPIGERERERERERDSKEVRHLIFEDNHH
jgi:hypothetical protein